MQIDHLDHLVLTVADVDATLDFYTRVLGMQLVTFGEARKALAFGNQKINLHQAGREFEPKAERPTPGSADLCFIVATPLDEVIAHLEAHRVAMSKVRSNVLARPARSARCTCAIPISTLSNCRI